MNTKLVVNTRRGETIEGVDAWRRLATVAAINAVIAGLIWTLAHYVPKLVLGSGWSTFETSWSIAIAVTVFLALTLCRFQFGSRK